MMRYRLHGPGGRLSSAKDRADFFSTASVVIRESILSFRRNRGFEVAGALSSYAFFSCIPLFFFITYLLGNYVVPSNVALRGVESLATHMFPPLSKAIMDEIAFLNRRQEVWGLVSLLMLLVSIIPFMDGLRSAFLEIFETGRRISFLRAQVLNLSAVLTALCFFALLIAAEIVYAALAAGISRQAPVLAGATDLAASFALVLILVLVFYGIVVPVKISRMHLLATSAAAGALLLCFKTFLSWFLVLDPEYGLAMGSLKIVGVIMFWVYCSLVVILFGAEIMVSLSKRDALLLKKLFTDGPPSLGESGSTFRRFVRTYAAGDVIVQEGERGNSLFYILSGSVTIEKKGRPIGTMQRGDYFGEMSMLLDAPNTATVIAGMTPVQAIVISHRNFEIILRENSRIVTTILRDMALRLKATSEKASSG
jgi:membrane protein